MDEEISFPEQQTRESWVARNIREAKEKRDCGEGPWEDHIHKNTVD